MEFWGAGTPGYHNFGTYRHRRVRVKAAQK